MNAELATVQPNAQPAPPQTLQSEKKERIPKKVQQAIALLVSGRAITQKAAADHVGMHEATLCRALRKSNTRVFYERAARESIAAGIMRASARLINLVDADSEHVSFDAAKHVLGIAGIKPQADAQVSVNIDIKAGYVIDLTEASSTYRDSMSLTKPNEIKDITPDQR